VNPTYVETLPKQGYRFIASISVANEKPALPPPMETIAVSADPQESQPQGKSRCLARMPVLASSIGLLVLAGIVTYFGFRAHPGAMKYTQPTDFTDSATAPALPADGHMIAFFRGSSSFFTADQIYLKMLPNGEAKRLTDDKRFKYNLAFSPDGSQIAYTVLEPSGFASYTVPVLGGDSHAFLNNAAGLTWLDEHRLLSSRISRLRHAYGDRHRNCHARALRLGGRDEWRRRLGAVPSHFAGRRLSDFNKKR
jgi:hypothetical protein